jgi:ABC-type nitrate/sulfonate/bicarbonate transport system permease component
MHKTCQRTVYKTLLLIMSLLHARERYTTRQKSLLALVGLVIFIALWWAVAEFNAEMRPIVDIQTHLPSSITDDTLAVNRDSIIRADSIKLANATEFEKVYPLLPRPDHVVKSYGPLFGQDNLLADVWLSVWRNLQGYGWAVIISLLVGFPIGLIPALRALFSKQVDALRYLPLTALTGLFIIWFGIGDTMKVAFLAFGILVYLLPVVVQRIDEVDDVYLKTSFTLGATNWQMVRSVYLPAVLSKLMDDIRVLTAISWTYIIIAEMFNRSGGVGDLIFVKGRQGQIEKVFAVLLVIVLIGFLQDRLFVYIDRRLFPYKHYKTVLPGLRETEYGVLAAVGALAFYLLATAVWPGGAELLGQLLFIIFITATLMVLYGEFRFQRAYVK